MKRLWSNMLSWLRPLGMREPAGLDAERYWLSVAAVALLGVALGLQATLLAIAVAGPGAASLPSESLTLMGRMNMQPEHELSVFYLGCVFTVLLCFGLLRGWNQRVGRRPGVAAGASALRAAAAIGSSASFVLFGRAAGATVDAAGHLPAASVLSMAAPGLAVSLWLVLSALRERRARRTP